MRKWTPRKIKLTLDPVFFPKQNVLWLSKNKTQLFLEARKYLCEEQLYKLLNVIIMILFMPCIIKCMRYK